MSKRLWLWLVPVLLLLTAMGGRGLDAAPLWIDELYSVGNIGAVYRVPFNPVQVWESVQQNSPQHVPGYFMILSGWAALVGWSPFALRALSLLFGLIAVAWTYRAGHDWFSPRSGLYAGLALSIGAVFIYFTHELRMYTLIAAETIFLLWLYRRIIEPGHQPVKWEWGLLFLGALALTYTHVIGLIPLAAIGLYHLLFVPKNRRWWHVAAVFIVAELLFLPWVSILLGSAKYGSRGDAALGPLEMLITLVTYFSSGNPLEFIVLLIFAAAAFVPRRNHVGALWFFTVTMFLLTVVMNQVTNFITFNRVRFLMPLWPLLALLVGLGLARIQRRHWPVAACLLGIWLGFDLSNVPNLLLSVMDGPRYVVDYPPLKEIVEKVNELAEPDHLLVAFAHHYHVFERFKFISIGEYYFHDLKIPSYRVTLPDPRSIDDIREDMLDAVGTRLSVWFAYEPEIDPSMLQPYRDILAEHYQKCATALDEADLRIERYDYAPFGCLDTPAGAPVLTYQEGITLTDLRTENSADGVLRIAAGWNVTNDVPPNTYSVSLKLWPKNEPEADFAGQVDYGLRSAGFGWQMASIPVDELPPGEYALTLTVYDWRLGQRLRATGKSGGEGDQLSVTDVVLPG